MSAVTRCHLDRHPSIFAKNLFLVLKERNQVETENFKRHPNTKTVCLHRWDLLSQIVFLQQLLSVNNRISMPLHTRPSGKFTPIRLCSFQNIQKDSSGGLLVRRRARQQLPLGSIFVHDLIRLSKILLHAPIRKITFRTLSKMQNNDKNDKIKNFRDTLTAWTALAVCSFVLCTGVQKRHCL